MTEASRRQWIEYHQAALVAMGTDWLVLDDTTRYGLRRKHIVRHGGLPDLSWVEVVRKDHPGARAWRFLDAHDIGHLYIVWKEQA